MTLRDLIDGYVVWRRSLGTDFTTEAGVLHRFVKVLDGDVDCDAVTRADALQFLAGNGPLTQTRALRYSVLKGLYSYAVSRGYAPCSPLPPPEDEPRKPFSPPAYVLTHDELRRIFQALAARRRRHPQVDVNTYRTFLLLLYGAGLRSTEARRLAVADVDLTNAVLTVRDSKFYKTRLVPVGTQLVGVLSAYAKLRAARAHPEGGSSPFLAKRDGARLARRTCIQTFRRLCCAAGIETDPVRLSPGLHSLRHSFAVHRLTAWYREGADVQRLLPVLSTYLGHATVAGTQVYLSMTPELLREAGSRFERYARGDGDA